MNVEAKFDNVQILPSNNGLTLQVLCIEKPQTKYSK